MEVLKIGAKSRLGNGTFTKLKLRPRVVVHIIHAPVHYEGHDGAGDLYDDDCDDNDYELNEYSWKGKLCPWEVY